MEIRIPTSEGFPFNSFTNVGKIGNMRLKPRNKLNAVKNKMNII